MKRRRTKPRLTGLAVLFVATVLLSACHDPQRALAPPNVDVAGIQTVVIFPFVNETGGRGLDETIVEGLSERLRAVGWYEVIGPERVASLLSAQRVDPEAMRPDSASWQETAREIAMELGADGFITGIVTQYDENVIVSPPYRAEFATTEAEEQLRESETTSRGSERAVSAGPLPDEASPWLVDQSTEVTVVASGTLVNVHTGVTVYDRTVMGTSHITDHRQLNWTADEPPPATLIPAPHRRDIDAGRKAAVRDALDQFTADILPRRVSNRGEDG